jgi:purine-binding chemotaxis protein CheW
MKEDVQLVVLTLDDRRYALYLSVVERVIRAVDVTPLPKAPEIVLGVINVQGAIIPVVNIRRRFHIPEREMQLGDQMLIARTARRVVALIVDSAQSVVELSGDNLIPPKDIVPGTSYLDGIVKLGDGIVLIHDLDRFLSLDEEQALDTALTKVNNTV